MSSSFCFTARMLYTPPCNFPCARACAYPDGELWLPEPVEADPRGSWRSRRAAMSDLLAVLVGIYGSKQMFVNEYGQLLSQQLLTKTDYDVDREVRLGGA